MTEEEWVKPKSINNALELAITEIKRLPSKSRIMMSSMTDPYQPIEQVEKITRSLIPILASRTDVNLIITTKSNLVCRDFDLIKMYQNISLCMTITSTQGLFDYEPSSPANPIRMEVLRQANELGIYTIASIEPWIPEVTKPLQILNNVYPFVKEVFLGSWNHHYRFGSEPYLATARIYREWLPEIEKFCRDHMIKLTVKKELKGMTMVKT